MNLNKLAIRFLVGITRGTILIWTGLVLACQGRESLQAKSEEECYSGIKPGWQRNLSVRDVKWDLYVPEAIARPGCTRLVLVLPGWKFPRTDWIKKTRIESIAERNNYILVLPEMNTTIYESEYYPETVMKWNSVPGGAFLRDAFFPELQRQYGLVRRNRPNYLLGLSTGGRGVVLVALQNPGLFRAGAAFSGDFDQTTETNDRLMISVYGDYARNRTRWETRDNPVSEILKTGGSSWTMPLYLAHGASDAIVPFSHSRWLFDSLRKTKPASFPLVYRLKKGAGHDYAFWDGELDAAFRFFDKPEAASFQ